MYIKKVSKFNMRQILVLFLITAFGLTFSPDIGFADISVDSYCELTIQSMEQEIPQLQELIALANQYSGDPQTLAQQEEIKRAEFDQAKEALFSSFGVTAEEYVTYMGKNGRAVNAYLDANLAVKQEIDDLAAQIDSLLQEYESLKE